MRYFLGNLLGVCLAIAALPIGAGAGELEQLQDKFAQTLAQTTQKHQAELDSIYGKYLGALKKIKSSYSKKGQLEPTLFVQKEIERFTADRSKPDTSASEKFSPLNRMQGSYLSKLLEIETRQNLAMLELGDNYQAALKELEVKLTQANKLEEALRARAERRKIQDDPRFKVREDLLDRTKPPPPPVRNSWEVIFRSQNPAIWNTSVKEGEERAVPLSSIDGEIKYLRLKRMDTGEAVIIPMTNVELDQEKSIGPIRWQGSAREYRESRMLGIMNTDQRYSSSREVQIRSADGNRYRGWGFGTTYLRENGNYGYGQGYTWNHQKLENPTVFEIAIKTSMLTTDEERNLLTTLHGGDALEGEDIITLSPQQAILKGNTKLTKGAVTGLSGDSNFVEWPLGTLKPPVKPGAYDVYITFSASATYSYYTASGVLDLLAVRDISRFRRDTFKVTSGHSGHLTQRISASNRSFQTLLMGQLEIVHLTKLQVAFKKSSSYTNPLRLQHVKLKPVE